MTARTGFSPSESLARMASERESSLFQLRMWFRDIGDVTYYAYVGRDGIVKHLNAVDRQEGVYTPCDQNFVGRRFTDVLDPLQGWKPNNAL